MDVWKVKVGRLMELAARPAAHRLKPMLRGWAGAKIETESEGCVPYVAKDLVILRRSAGGQNGLMFFVEVI